MLQVPQYFVASREIPQHALSNFLRYQMPIAIGVEGVSWPPSLAGGLLTGWLTAVVSKLDILASWFLWRAAHWCYCCSHPKSSNYYRWSHSTCNDQLLQWALVQNPPGLLLRHGYKRTEAVATKESCSIPLSHWTLCLTVCASKVG